MAAATLALILLAAPARAVDRLVPGAFLTIGAAVAAALPGDRILVSSGIYQENVTSNIPNLQFIGKSTVWDGTLTNGTAGTCLTSTGNLVSVKGFIFRAGAANNAQVQLTGDGCRVGNCSSRGPSARFLKMTGNSNVVESCSMFAVNSTAIEIIGDAAVVKKVTSRQGDDSVILVQGHFATVTGCTMTLNEDGSSINITGSNAIVSLNMFLYCDLDITVNGANATVTKNKTVRNGSTFVSVSSTGAGPVVTQNTAMHCVGAFLSLSGSNTVVRQNKATDCRSTFLSASSSGAGAVVEQNTVTRCGGTFMSLSGSNAVVRKNMATDCAGTFLSASSSGAGAFVEQNTVMRCGGTFMSLSGSNAVVRQNTATDCWGSFLSLSGAGALVEQNTGMHCANTFISVNGANAVVRQNKAMDSFGSISVSGDNAVVNQNQALTLGSISVTGDNLTIRKNTISGAPNDRHGIFASQNTVAGTAVIEDNKVTDCAQSGLRINCNNAVVQRNRVSGAGTESDESGCYILGSFNRLTNNVVIGCGTHGFQVSGATNILVNCSATDAAADGFHIEGAGSTLLRCVAMLCSGEGLDNGAAGTTVVDCLFKRNRLDVANDGLFAPDNATFIANNVFTTGGPTTLPQVD